MHPTTTTALRGRRWVFLVLLGAFLLLALAQAVPALAASSFTGGLNYLSGLDTSTMVANDHTVYATRITASASSGGLAGSTTYHVKLRFTPNADGSPAGTDNRGFTWNSTTSAWVQEREDWASFPTITTAHDGSIAASDATWLFYKFGDTTKTGTYYLIASLSTGASGGTFNGTAFVEVKVLDQTTTGAWVHDGATAGTGQATKTASVRLPDESPSPTPTPVARQRSEPNVCDDDGDGIVDNEQYGPVASGTFRMAVPTTPTDTYLIYLPGNSNVWPVGSDRFKVSIPDTDIAIGATSGDMTAPTAPTSPAATAGDASAVVSWTAATDATGVAGYHVYRWTDAPTGAGYTPMPVKVGTVTTGTTFTDTGLTNGTAYHYLVRAFDAATNVGPRSTTVDATPLGVTSLTLSAAPVTVGWGKPWTLSGALTSGGAAVPNAAAKLMQSVDGGSTWTLVNTLTPATGTSTYSGSIAAPLQKSQYKLVFDGDASHASCESTPVTVAPKVKLGKPSAPKSVKKKKSFSVSGSLTPKAKAGSKTVQVKCYLKKSGKWVLEKKVMAKNSTKGSASVYKVKTSLPKKGSWKLVAHAKATSNYAATTSGAFYLKAK
jgi:hypothetical protein